MIKADVSEGIPLPKYPRLTKVTFTDGVWIALQIDDHRAIVISAEKKEHIGQFVDVQKYATTDYIGKLVLSNDDRYNETTEY